MNEEETKLDFKDDNQGEILEEDYYEEDLQPVIRPGLYSEAHFRLYRLAERNLQGMK